MNICLKIRINLDVLTYLINADVAVSTYMGGKKDDLFLYLPTHCYLYYLVW